MSYVSEQLEKLKAKNANEPEFIQAATEVLTSLEPVFEQNPKYQENAILERRFYLYAEILYVGEPIRRFEPRRRGEDRALLARLLLVRWLHEEEVGLRRGEHEPGLVVPEQRG